MLNPQTILVTGGAGFIGSFFCDMMLAEGHHVICLDKLSYAGNMDNLAQAQQHENFKFVKGDICDGALVETLLEENNVTWLVNFAAESHVDNSIAGPEIFIDTNIKGTFNLLDCALKYYKTLEGQKKESFRYLQISTDEVYGALGETGEFDETTAYKPNSPYSASKAAADHLVRAWYQTYGLPTLTTNCSNNYGPRQHVEKFIPVIVRSCVEEAQIPVYGTGKNVRDWLYVKDHCNGIYLALTKGTLGETYCLGGGVELSNLDLATKICEIMDEKHPRSGGKSYKELISFVEDRLGHDFRYAIDCTKASKALGYEASGSLSQHLGETIDWYITQFKRGKAA